MVLSHNDSMCIACCFGERREETDAVLASPSGFLGGSANLLSTHRLWKRMTRTKACNVMHRIVIHIPSMMYWFVHFKE